MKIEDFTEGQCIYIGIYEGVIVEIGENFVVVNFKTWVCPNTRTGDSKITFTHYGFFKLVP